MERFKLKRILIIRSDRFGEFLLSLAAVKLIKDNFSQSSVSLLAQRSNIELIRGINFIAGSPDVDKKEHRNHGNFVKEEEEKHIH